MGPINWLAVILSANLAFAVGLVWYGPLFGGADLFGRVSGRDGASGDAGKGTGVLTGIGGAVLLQALSALMLGHNFARLGADKLAAKPWLYWMQSGGIALAFVIPAVWLAQARQGADNRQRLIDGGYWLVAYLAMGATFWALR